MALSQGSRLVILFVAALALTGCFQAQLNGPVSGAQFEVTELRDSAVVLVENTGMTEASVIADKGAEEWAGFGALLRLLHFGVITDKLVNPSPDTLYLVAATGGQDLDWNQDLKPDAAGTKIQGQWHAITSGNAVNNAENKVSALTEAVYQWLAPALGSLSDEQVLQYLDRIAPSLVGDVNNNGSIEYSDVLEWSHLLKADASLLRADPQVLLGLATNVRNNGSLERRLELAVQLLGEPSPVAQNAEDVFASGIAAPVLDARCFACHVPGGVADAGGAKLLFDAQTGPEQQATNIAAFREFLALAPGNDDLLLSKVQGVSHGGGPVFGAFTDEYRNLEAFLALLSGDGDSGLGGTGDGLAAFWNGVTLADSAKTLRRAAIILAGRLPTESEYELAGRGDKELRRAVRGLMKGPGFREFLVRGANDRLHLDVFYNYLQQPEYLDQGVQPIWGQQAHDMVMEEGGEQGYFKLERQLAYGGARGTLELFAHVVDNDKPYTEILTADYLMVNPQLSVIQRSGVSFPSEDHRVFKPGKYKGQVFHDDQYRNSTGYIGNFFYTLTNSHSGFYDFPHAGVLNSPAFLVRYPTTETNRNRARARWAYYHFLGVDIEQSASRTTDPAALADTNNPTLNNPACVVCHERMDPVAGAFQNYNESGQYLPDGRDALPATYKWPEEFDETAGPSLYRDGDTWFRDMRAPGFEGARINNSRKSSQWLARQITADPRFANAAIAFWWPALMGFDVLRPPGSPSDPDYEQKLRAFDAQQASIDAFADELRAKQYNLKTALVNMVTSPWFRADSVDPVVAEERAVELANVGTGRLLTPEELEVKTKALLGYSWGESEEFEWNLDGVYSELQDRYRIYYGGIDSRGIKERARALTPVMTNVVARQSNEEACEAVVLDFLKPTAQRRLFKAVEKTTTPLLEARGEFRVAFGDYDSSRKYRLKSSLDTTGKRLKIDFTNDGANEQTGEDRNLYIESVEIRRGGKLVKAFEGKDFLALPGFDQTRGDGWEVGGSWGSDTPQGFREVAWGIYGQGYAAFDFSVAEQGEYDLVVNAWGSSAGDGVLPQMAVSIESSDPFANSVGSQQVHRQIQELYALFLGTDLPIGHPELESAYRLLVERWQERLGQPDTELAWSWPDEDCLIGAELTDEQWTEMTADPARMLSAWTSVLAYLLTHHDYMHE